MSEPFRIELLGRHHDRKTFGCGMEALDRYLREQASQDIRRRITACYVALDANTNTIAGYYTLAAGAVALTALPESLAKRLPRYPYVPVARLGRLALDLAYRGRKLGGALLWDAGLRALRSDLAALALVVDAKDELAEAFYRHHGFVSLLRAETRQLFLPLATFGRP